MGIKVGVPTEANFKGDTVAGTELCDVSGVVGNVLLELEHREFVGGVHGESEV